MFITKNGWGKKRRCVLMCHLRRFEVLLEFTRGYMLKYNSGPTRGPTSYGSLQYEYLKVKN